MHVCNSSNEGIYTMKSYGVPAPTSKSMVFISPTNESGTWSKTLTHGKVLSSATIMRWFVSSCVNDRFFMSFSDVILSAAP